MRGGRRGVGKIWLSCELSLRFIDIGRGIEGGELEGGNIDIDEYIFRIRGPRL